MRRRLLGYTDTKAEALRRLKGLTRKGYTNLLIKKEYNGYSILGVITTRRR